MNGCCINGSYYGRNRFLITTSSFFGCLHSHTSSLCSLLYRLDETSDLPPLAKGVIASK